MQFKSTPLDGAYVIEPEPYKDDRGTFSRIFCLGELKSIGHSKNIVQMNHSITRKKGSIRGMHFQRPPSAEIKFVKCIKGCVFDVILDLRQNSPTCLKWFGGLLSDKNMKTMYIPEGFAHGFQVVEPNSELLYFHTAPYCPVHQGAVRYNDPLVSIVWPLSVEDVSKRDLTHASINDNFDFL